MLELELEDERRWKFHGRQRQRRWKDRASWQLEDRLSHLFREIQERIVEAERIDELMEMARRQLVEQGRIIELRAQVARLRESELIRRYCDAIEETHGDDPQCIEWIGWARGFAARLNPLREAPSMPDPPEETPETLQEFLPDGWSARGPEYGHRYPWGTGRLR